MKEIGGIREVGLSDKNIQMLELCMSCLRNLAVSKTIFREFLSHSDENLALLPECLKKSLKISEKWKDACNNEIVLFKQICDKGTELYTKI